ncbi:MAG TPA: MFS transporter [Candidatus Ratteibacteria bacterium]|nr:MFS transporter [Candidatus Ratteibacteria bacterium]
MEHWRKHLYTIWFAETISLIGFSFCLTFMPYYLQELGVKDIKQVALWTGLLQTVGPLMMVISAPFWGILSDRKGRKIMVERAMFSGFVILILMSFARNVQHLLILRILQGFFTGTFTAAIVLAASQMPKEKSGYGLGLMQTSSFIASSAGPFLGGIASDIWGYRNSFFFSGILVGLAGCMVMFGVQEQKQIDRETQQNSDNEKTRNDLFFLFIILFLFQFSITLLSPVIAIFIQKITPEARKIATIAGSIIAISGIASVFSAILAGHMSGKHDNRILLSVMLIISGIFTMLATLSKSPGQLMFLRILSGLSAGGIIPIINTSIHLGTKKTELGKNFGIAGGISSLGSGCGPIVGGALASVFSLEFTFIFSGMMMIITGAICPVLLEKIKVDKEGKGIPEITDL